MHLAKRVTQAFVQRALLAAVISLVLSSCYDGSPRVTTTAGASPFISLMHVQNLTVADISSVEYTIAPKTGTVSKAVHVQYTLAALQARNYVVGANEFTLPIYGLYAGYLNQVTVIVHYSNGSTRPFVKDIQTDAYTDPTGIYSNPTIVTPRTTGSQLGFNFIYIKSALGSPVIIDTDAQIRWVAPGVTSSTSSDLISDEFVVGDSASAMVNRLRLDGSLDQSTLPPPTGINVLDFTHDIRKGKTGLLAEVDTITDTGTNIGSTALEFTNSDANTVTGTWDVGAILSAYMSSQGDDPTLFVRPGVDWFHINSAIYDASDNTVIVSSRENFVIKLDYATGNIIWIFGDPTKYWYTFPSLRAKAITLAAGGLYPVGQHGLTLTADGLLMLFNDGAGSLNEPTGTSAGVTRTYSAVSAYAINQSNLTATNPWNYDAGQSIYSAFCSSAFETKGPSYLVDYAYASGGQKAILVGLDSQFQTVFSFQYDSSVCGTSWNARPIPFDNLVVNQ